MAVPISFNSINVNSQNSDASIAVGENQQNNWSSHSKENSGNGSFVGWNVILNSFNTIYDPDDVDFPIHDGDIVTSSQGQAR